MGRRAVYPRCGRLDARVLLLGFRMYRVSSSIYIRVW